MVESPAFWIASAAAFLAVAGFRARRRVGVYWKICKLRLGRGAADADVVAEMFYRVAARAGASAPQRQPHETWREWIGRLPDPERRGLVRGALAIFEKARYGAAAVTPDEYTRLEETLRRLKRA